MASMLSNYRAELNLLLQMMLAEGLVNNDFLRLQSLKATLGRDVVIQRITSYSDEVKNLFTEMSKKLDMQVVDFKGILVCALDLLEKCNSIGVVYIDITCVDILNACFEKEIDCCKQELTTAKREFAELQVKLELVVKLERDIVECEDMSEPKIDTNPCESTS